MSDHKSTPDEIKPPRKKLFRAITSTNFIGMPALLVYIFAVIGVVKQWTYVKADFLLDPLFLSTTFFLLILISAFFVILHYRQVMRLMRPVEEFLELDPAAAVEDRRELAREALLASEWFPYHTFYWSAFYYIIGPPLAVAAIQIPYCFSLRESYSLLLGVSATGIVISVFQFYASRRALADFQAAVLSEFPELLLEERDSKRSIYEVGLKPKLIFAIVVLAFLMVILTSVAAVNTAHRGLQLQAANFYKEQLSKQIPLIEQEIDTGTAPEALYQKLETLALDKSDVILALDEKQESLYGGELDPRFQRLAELILQDSAWRVWGRDPVVKFLGEDVYSAVLGFTCQYAVVRLPLTVKGAAPEGGSSPVPEIKANLLVLIPASRYNYALVAMDVMIWSGLIVGIFLAVYYGKLSSEDIRDPLRSVMMPLEAMAAGDLRDNVLVTSRDEMGVLSRSLGRALFGLRRLIGKVSEAVDELEQASAEISTQSEDVASGSADQVREADNTSGTMENMKSSVQGIAESVQTLASSTEESSASILEVQATIEHVDNNVETLSDIVIETTASIQEMSMSVGEVADNVQYLTRRSEEATSALTEVERMIEKVSDGSRETAVITGRVSEDADKGVHAVQSTIAGIDNIQEASREVSEVITSLGQRAIEIGNILNVINDVTEETNLLALNAAIIAAQAGEHGRGFSVVADEIKDLAERTAASTSEIAELIQSVQDDAVTAVDRMKKGLASISEGVRIAGDAGQALNQIRDSVGQATEQTQAIAVAVSVQTRKSKQLMEFMDGVNALIAQVALATQEQKKSGEQIIVAAEKMRDITSQVKRATAEQRHGSRQITQAIEHIAEITNFINTAQTDQLRSTESVRVAVAKIQEVAGGNQQRVAAMNQSVSSLKKLSRELQDLIEEFRL